MMVMATQARGRTVIRDARELRVKESDRLAAMGETLAAAGAKIELFEDGCAIEGPTPLRGVTVKTRLDHRIAMSMAVAQLLAAARRSSSTTSPASRPASPPSSRSSTGSARGGRGDLRQDRALRRRRPPDAPQALARDAERRLRAPRDRRRLRGAAGRAGAAREALAGAHALGFRGLNVTVPHKQAVVALCKALDPVAREVGAVNTLRRAGDGWEGFNTDAPALLQLLDEAGSARRARAARRRRRGGARGGLGGARGGRGAAGRGAAAGRGRAALRAALAPLAAAGARRAGRGAVGRARGGGGAADAIVNATTIGLHAGRRRRLPLARARRAGRRRLRLRRHRASSAPRARRARGSSPASRSWCARGRSPSRCGLGEPAPEAVMVAAVARAAGGR